MIFKVLGIIDMARDFLIWEKLNNLTRINAVPLHQNVFIIGGKKCMRLCIRDNQISL